MIKRTKIHLYIIISCLIIVIAAAMGTVFHFTSGGFFNYGVENSSGADVTVTYSTVSYTQSGVEEICEKAFENANLSGYVAKTSESDCYIEYTFSYNTDEAALQSAVSAINSAFADGAKNEYEISVADYHYYEAVVGNAKTYIWASIAAAIAIGVQAVYIVIRYRLTMGAVSIVSNLHSLLLFISLLAITRIPLGTYAVGVAALCLLVNMICQQMFMSKVNASFKSEETSGIPADEQVETVAKSNIGGTTCLCAAMAIVCVIYAIAVAIGSFSITALAPALAAICACAVCWYTSAVFTPVVYACAAKNAKISKKAKRAKKADKENKADK